MENVVNKPANAETANVPANAHGIAMPYNPAETHGPAHKYRDHADKLACAAVKFKLTGAGAAYAATGNGKQGKPTAQALVCKAAKLAGASNAKAVTGLQIAEAFVASAEIAEALRLCKTAKYAPGTRLPCPAWLSGYINGNARTGLLAKVAG